MVKLERTKDARDCVATRTESEPFVINDMAVLIHRPRYISEYKLSGHPRHMAIECWCGASHTGWTKFTFVDKPPENRMVCHSCESRAVMFGQPSSEELVGRHVHIGRMRAIKDCCGGGD